MGLFTGFLRPAQQPVAEPPNIKALPASSFVDALADAISEVPNLAIPAPPIEPKPRSISAPATRYAPGTAKKRRSGLRTRRVQLNIYVSAELRRDLRAYAKRHRATMGELVEHWCRLGMSQGEQ
jgi:hypothetical protein